MSSPYVGEIRMFAGSFAPNGWMFCQGQLLAISQYDTLFNLIGTTYGGDGQSTFALPNLSSRVPVHNGTSAFGNYVIGQMGGAENVTLTAAQIPNHTHQMLCNSSSSSSPTPAGQYPGASSSNVYGPNSSSSGTLNPAAVANSGGSQPHDNLMPYLAVSFIISLFGIYPSQT
jgi:microcystin-dependent protein